MTFGWNANVSRGSESLPLVNLKDEGPQIRLPSCKESRKKVPLLVAVPLGPPPPPLRSILVAHPPSPSPNWRSSTCSSPLNTNSVLNYRLPPVES